MARFLRQRGAEVPESFREPRDIRPELLPIWIAFHDLSASRPAGFSACGLPWAELSAYCADHGISGSMRLRWCRLIRALDRCWLLAQAEARKSKRKETADGDS